MEPIVDRIVFWLHMCFAYSFIQGCRTSVFSHGKVTSWLAYCWAVSGEISVRRAIGFAFEEVAFSSSMSMQLRPLLGELALFTEPACSL